MKTNPPIATNFITVDFINGHLDKVINIGDPLHFMVLIDEVSITYVGAYAHPLFLCISRLALDPLDCIIIQSITITKEHVQGALVELAPLTVPGRYTLSLRGGYAMIGSIPLPSQEGKKLIEFMTMGRIIAPPSIPVSVEVKLKCANPSCACEESELFGKAHFKSCASCSDSSKLFCDNCLYPEGESADVLLCLNHSTSPNKCANSECNKKFGFLSNKRICLHCRPHKTFCNHSCITDLKAPLGWSCNEHKKGIEIMTCANEKCKIEVCQEYGLQNFKNCICCNVSSKFYCHDCISPEIESVDTFLCPDHVISQNSCADCKKSLLFGQGSAICLHCHPHKIFCQNSCITDLKAPSGWSCNEHKKCIEIMTCANENCKCEVDKLFGLSNFKSCSLCAEVGFESALYCFNCRVDIMNTVAIEDTVYCITHINSHNVESETLLHIAVRSCNDKLVKQLCLLNVDFELMDKNGDTALIVAEKLHFDVIAELIRKEIYRRKGIIDRISNVFESFQERICYFDPKFDENSTYGLQNPLKKEKYFRVVQIDKTDTSLFDNTSNLRKLVESFDAVKDLKENVESYAIVKGLKESKRLIDSLDTIEHYTLIVNGNDGGTHKASVLNYCDLMNGFRFGFCIFNSLIVVEVGYKIIEHTFELLTVIFKMKISHPETGFSVDIVNERFELKPNVSVECSLPVPGLALPIPVVLQGFGAFGLFTRYALRFGIDPVGGQYGLFFETGCFFKVKAGKYYFRLPKKTTVPTIVYCLFTKPWDPLVNCQIEQLKYGDVEKNTATSAKLQTDVDATADEDSTEAAAKLQANRDAAIKPQADMDAEAAATKLLATIKLQADEDAEASAAKLQADRDTAIKLQADMDAEAAAAKLQADRDTAIKLQADMDAEAAAAKLAKKEMQLAFEKAEELARERKITQETKRLDIIDAENAYKWKLSCFVIVLAVIIAYYGVLHY